jgi:RHS repeat-associated protein
MSVSGISTYDDLGRSIAQYHPISELKTNTTKYKFNPAVAPNFAQTKYDEIDRPIISIDAEGNESFMEYSIQIDNTGTMALKTKTIVPQNANQNIISATYKDVQGRVISIMNQWNDEIWTQFAYNAIGELMEYSDAEGLTTKYEYDLLGRKVSVSHPDQGTTKYTYDKASNLVELYTANLSNSSEFIQYFYDHNRIKQILYPDTPSGANISNVDYSYGDASLSGSDANNRGRLVLQVDGTGEQRFGYGNMGEMTTNHRTVVGPNIPTREFKTTFHYDSWNRLNTMVYPDGEKVNYQYDLGGNLTNIISNLQTYIERIDYDHFEQRTYLLYGNNTETYYNYAPTLRRLSNLNVIDSQQEALISASYDYDLAGNVIGLSNAAGINSSTGIGGAFNHNYSYDQLNRLIEAGGDFNGNQVNRESDYQSFYKTRMIYNNTHGISEKYQYHEKNNNLNPANTYDNIYKYQDGTHRLENIDGGSTTENFAYDLNGNITHRDHSQTGGVVYKWDESNRLRVVYNDRGFMQHSIYDASGERVLKASSHYEAVYENGSLINPTISFDSYTTYPSAFLVIDPNGIYSKHYYAGTQRIVSRLGDDNADIFNTGANRTTTEKDDSKKIDETALRNLQVTDLKAYLKDAKIGEVSFKEYKGSTYQEEETLLAEDLKENRAEGDLEQERAPVVAPVYFYHPDHLGSSTFLTDANGNAYQFFINLPFGETMAEQLPDTYYRTPFKFNGKELDEETGLYYYGARYYDPKISIWLSVDPLAEAFPNWNPYNYTMQNPINLVDPTGMSSEEPGDGDPPKKKIRSRLDGWNKTVSNFNNSVNSGINEFMRGNPFENTAEATLNFLNNSVSTLGDITLISNLMGYENRTANAIGNGIDNIVNLPNMTEAQQGATFATGSIFLIQIAVTKKMPLGSIIAGTAGERLATKLLKYGDDGVVPTPLTTPLQFKSKGEEIIHSETGSIYRKSNTTHRGKSGEYKIFPAGTTEFGKTSKTTGKRITTDLDGKIIGH